MIASALGDARVGIDAMHVYPGRACVGVRELFEARGLNLSRFDKLGLVEKSVPLPCEDAVTNAVNAAKPLVDRLDPRELAQIELLITATESGPDLGKSSSTWVHQALGLSSACRLLEVKQACYAATAALQLAAGFVAASPRPIRALVVSTDHPLGESRGTYHEPSQGTMGVAMLVGTEPRLLELDLGASGCFAAHVDDACRPAPELETGDPQLTLFAYLDGLVGSYRDYCSKVGEVDVLDSFAHLAFHTPFGGMVAAAHRKLLATFARVDRTAIAADFARRVEPSLRYCVRTGNGYSAALYLALCGLVDGAELREPARVGLFSYGSGSSAEFYSGVLGPSSREQVARIDLPAQLDARARLSLEEYEALLDARRGWALGVSARRADPAPYRALWESHVEGAGLYVLDRIEGYRRSYRWS